MRDHEKRLEQARRRAEGLAAIRLRYRINTPSSWMRATARPTTPASRTVGGAAEFPLEHAWHVN